MAATASPFRVALAPAALRPFLVMLLLAVLGWPCGGARAAADLPQLTGRVVDDAGLLSAAAQSRIEAKLKTLEDQSGIQLVVATVKSLGGEEIEPYANRLFRAWKLGEQKKNNGVLLVVAPTERKVRIEVGYGLEGTLTDATSKLIMVNAMTPRFKAGDYQGGIESGLDDIIAVLSTDKADWQKRPHLQAQSGKAESGISIGTIVVVIVVLFVLFALFRRSRGRRGPGGMIFIPGGGSGWSSGGGSSGGGSSGDSGFSGGGGSSGGGGASDSW
ncbi:MAG TPA: TPM domain-containing protein [Lichenihabitans sp.]|jgi:uncharacterized protein|nr:TPM domain-containing protein [Lichenihabitans sp.]